MEILKLSKRINDERKRLERLYQTNKDLLSAVGRIDIVFSQSREKLGVWHENEKTVVLSECLIGNPDIDSVFLHELAHALDFSRRGMSEHDAVFRETCRELGVPEGFEKAKAKLSEEKKEKILEKAKKLIALSDSPFENESAEALKKAQKMLAEHSLTLENDDPSSSTTDDELFYVILSRKGRYMSWEKCLFQIVRRLTGSFLLKDKTGEGTVMKAFGDEETVENAGFFYEYLIAELKNEKRKMKGRVSDMNSYLLGLADGLYDRVTRDEDVTRALVLSERRSEEKFKRLTEHRVHHRSGGSTRIDPSSYGSGVRDSRKLSLPRKTDKKKGKYLPL